MAIFPHLDLEETIQINDKTRLDGTRSFITQDEAAITLVEIEPEGAAGFIDVTPSPATKSSEYYLDWQYTGATRTVTVTVRITTDGAPTSFSETMEVTTAADDMLFSNDQDLISKESDILKFVRKGRNSFLDMHRRSQEIIVAWFDERGVTDTSGAKLTKAAFTDLTEVREWSSNLTLSLIFQDLSNVANDVFSQKSTFYAGQAANHRNRSIFRFDEDGSGAISAGEGSAVATTNLLRR